MTTQRLRDLMEERVADVETDDLATRAWARADGVRRRRRIAVTGTAVAAVLAVAAAWLRSRTGATPPSASPSGRVRPRTTSPLEPTDAAAAPRAVARRRVPRRARSGGRRRPTRDAELPVLQVPGIPAELSMADELPSPTSRRTTWTRCSALGKQQYRLLSDERLPSVDLSDRLGVVADEGGNEFSPLGPGSVSPDGTQVFFRQPGRVEVWDLATQHLADGRRPPTYESTAWTRDGTMRHRTRPTADRTRGTAATTSGRSRSRVRTARRPSWTGWPRDRARRRRASPAQFANPEFLAAGTPAAPDLLAFGMGRNKMCCVADGVVQPRLRAVLRPPSPTARTGCWPGGSARRTCTASATTPTSRRRNFSASWAEDAFR